MLHVCAPSSGTPPKDGERGRASPVSTNVLLKAKNSGNHGTSGRGRAIRDYGCLRNRQGNTVVMGRDI